MAATFGSVANADDCRGVVGLRGLIARAYQQGAVKELAENYETSDQSVVNIAEITDGDNTLLKPTGWVPDLSGNLLRFDIRQSAQYYFVMEVDLAQCGQIFTVAIKYQSLSPFFDYSRTISITKGETNEGITKVFVPAASVTQESQFLGFLVRSAQVRCVRQIKAIRHTGNLPLPLWLVLRPNWRDEPRFQTLSTAVGSGTPRGLQVATTPASLLDFVTDQQLKIKPLGESAWQFIEKNNQITKQGIIFDGYAPLRHGYGAMTEPTRFKKGAIIVTRGKGSTKASIGLLSDQDKWAAVALVPAGTFLSAVQVPEDGIYRVVLSQNLDGFWPFASVNFEQIGVLGPM